MLSTTLLSLSLLPLSLAHFTLDWPVSRSKDEDSAGNFPCGGGTSVGSRTDFPISGGPLQLNLGHEQTNLAVYMAVGANPGSGFSVVMRPQLQVQGLGNFCVGQISVPSGVNVSDGTLASIQVVSNAHSSGGLYQCTDVTLRTATLSQSDYSSHCQNNTGVTVSQQNISGNPNGTSTSTANPTASGSGAAASPSASHGAASGVKAASWAMGAVGVAGLALL
ncbi:hypothetical protein EK21DRAFT_78939 [Setomelanomma holmii]|uniref:Copper acquisition factor BIM1-like domain-containing protein n=1 Tax=Setomelanomma holmii TaxID=210430 RepID=A0A9P4LGL8_9PLEO|nr:hypothetical protein EK21DRAFT_78939 [Setomelanomma holmii]